MVFHCYRWLVGGSRIHSSPPTLPVLGPHLVPAGLVQRHSAAGQEHCDTGAPPDSI